MRSAENGIAHVLYRHEAGPTYFSLRCPRCEAEAIAKHPLVAFRESMSHLDPQYRAAVWSIACSHCPYRKRHLGHDAMRALGPLYFSSSAHDLWAWNRPHLEMIQARLEGRSVARESLPFADFRHYLPRKWLTHRKKYLKLAAALLLGCEPPFGAR